MPGYQCILAPTDFSKPAAAAVHAASGLARQYKAELHLLHIVATQAYYAEMPEMMLPPMEGFSLQLLASGKEKIAELASGLGREIHVHTRVEESPARPADTIAEVARSIKADLIVIGSHGRTGLMHILLGSTAERVVRESACDVLVIKPKNDRKTGDR